MGATDARFSSTDFSRSAARAAGKPDVFWRRTPDEVLFVMQPHTPIDYEPAPDALIDVLLQRLADDPGNLDVHRELRTAALKRKVNGGPPAGTFAKMRPLPSDPLRRLIQLERLWSLDPGDLDWLVEVARAIEDCATERPEVDFEPVRRWLHRIAQAARAGA